MEGFERFQIGRLFKVVPIESGADVFCQVDAGMELRISKDLDNGSRDLSPAERAALDAHIAAPALRHTPSAVLVAWQPRRRCTPCRTRGSAHILLISHSPYMAASGDSLLVLWLFIGPSHLIFFLRQTSHARCRISISPLLDWKDGQPGSSSSLPQPPSRPSLYLLPHPHSRPHSHQRTCSLSPKIQSLHPSPSLGLGQNRAHPDSSVKEITQRRPHRTSAHCRQVGPCPLRLGPS